MIVIFVTGTTGRTTIGGDINLAADNRLDARFFSSQVKFNGTIHNPVVSYRQAIHSQLSSSLNQLGNAAHTIKQTIFSMNMKMSKHTTPSDGNSLIL